MAQEMSATRKPRRRARLTGSTATQRLRKVHCSTCGYLFYASRKVIAVGLPNCPNHDCASFGEQLECADIGDAIETGLRTLDELPRAERTRICHERGWQDAIIRTNAAQEPGAIKRATRQCGEPQCSTFVKRGETYCSAHASSDMPF